MTIFLLGMFAVSCFYAGVQVARWEHERKVMQVSEQLLSLGVPVLESGTCTACMGTGKVDGAQS